VKTYLLTTIILLHFFNLNGQSISGTVRDEKTGKAIQFANVSLWKKDSTVFQGTLSDSLGKFSFKKIVVSFGRAILAPCRRRFIIKLSKSGPILKEIW
jgi:hypothetical protein